MNRTECRELSEDEMHLWAPEAEQQVDWASLARQLGAHRCLLPAIVFSPLCSQAVCVYQWNTLGVFRIFES